MQKIMIAAVLAIGGTAGAQNLLNNAGFESELGFDFSNLSNWNGFFGAPPETFLEAFNTTGAPAFEGAQALELTIQGAGTSNGNDSFTGHVQIVSGLTGGEPYELSMWARNNNSNLDGVLEWRVEWQDAGGVEISREQIEVASLLTDTYQNFSFESLAPAGATQAAIVVAVATGADLGFVYDHSVLVDDTSLTLVPAPASAALLGLGGLAALRRRRA